ncbi:DUF3164 family protein [Reyranella sp.]|uniref:DUF3164 family protein n=1 Tax=Reyranella sp. TaxID=1929291 RepID=UPI00272FCE36|nr:DUF3164 family protein [Reyranella sp.]MDP2376558.1 DUF3164 family protein [Reyranella sp.]
MTAPAPASPALGQEFMVDAKGRHVPVATIKPQDLLMDEVVRKVVGYAVPLSEQIGRFRQHCFDDVDAFIGLLEQNYGGRRKGWKGNMVLTSFDGLFKVTVQVADAITFGPELQVAKGLVDECLTDWSGGANVNLQAIVQRAFNVDQAGKINRAELLSLLRLDIADARWQQAMTAIRDSMRVIGSKRYVRIHTRADLAAPWRMVSIDMASA